MKLTFCLLILTIHINLINAQVNKFLTEVPCRSLRGGIECNDTSIIGVGINNSFAGYDTVYCITCSPNGDTIITEKWLPDFYLIKTDKYGDTLWTKKFGGLGEDWVEDIKAIEDDYIITGYSSSNSKGNYDSYLARVNNTGDTIWSFLIGGEQCDWAFSSVVSSANDIYSIGSSYSFGNGRIGSDDIYLIKSSAIGDTIYTKTFGDSIRGESGLDIIQTSDENLVILASSVSDANREIIVFKINSMGNIIWEKHYSGNYVPSKILEDDQDNLVITGTRYEFGDNYDEDLFLFKLNSNGDSIWIHIYGEMRESGYYINKTADKNYIICGSTGGVNGGQSDLGLFKISQSGEQLWKRTFNLSEGSADWGKYLKETYDGGFVVIGTKGLGGSFILKTNENGLLSNVNELSSLHDVFLLYPLPFKDNLNIQNNDSKEYECSIYESSGKLISTLKVYSGLNHYNLSSLKVGAYIYIIFDKNSNKIDNGKIIKTFANSVYN